MPTALTIDFVSDVSCPWCAIGLSALEVALARVAPDITVDLHIQPFELNPQMGPGGQDITEHLTQKYGSTPEQQDQIRESIRLRGETVGFTFRREGRGRIYKTFDAHRLMHWAGLPETQPVGRQHALKKALLQAYFTQGLSPESHEVLVQAAESVGLDGAQARAVLASDAYTAEVRAAQRYYTDAGIHSVPAVIINQRHLISGGQPADTFEQALRQIAAAQA
ncbi:MAG: hypothetical protein RL459_1132 [Pseudomonadota bacterium]|jgi:predicted DsbA family dithiol-disulfide isomerase